MKRTIRATPFLLGGLLTAAALAVAAPAPQTITDVIKDRKDFIPQRKQQPLPGKAVGVLVSNVAPIMNQEGRSGPADAYGFSVGGNSYRWIYVPVQEKPLITRLQVPTGAKGDRIKVYPRLNLANPATVKQWNITAPFALVEVEVNDGLGSPAIEGFVATRMTRLDGTSAFPLKVPEVIEEVRKQQQRLKQEQQTVIASALAEAEKSALKGKKATGPRETSELFYVTWLPETDRLRIHFRTTISDGHFQQVEIGQRLPPVALPPGPIPLPPNQGKPAVPVLRPPPPARFRSVRVGTAFGIEMGFAFEVTKTGKIDRVLTLPIQPFTRELPQPPGIGPRGAPLPVGR